MAARGRREAFPAIAGKRRAGDAFVRAERASLGRLIERWLRDGEGEAFGDPRQETRLALQRGGCFGVLGDPHDARVLPEREAEVSFADRPEARPGASW